MRLKDPPLLGAVIAIATLVTVAGHVNQKPELIWLFTPLTSALIAWSAWRRGTLAERYAQGVFLALAVALVADLLLIAAPTFALGLLALACVHGALLAAAWTAGRPTGAPLALVLGLALSGAALVVAWPSLSVPVRLAAGSTAVLGALALAATRARAVSLGARAERAAGVAPLAWGGIALVLLATAARLLDVAAPNALAAAWILPLHWAGLTLVALSIPCHAQKISDSHGVADAAPDPFGPHA